MDNSYIIADTYGLQAALLCADKPAVVATDAHFASAPGINNPADIR